MTPADGGAAFPSADVRDENGCGIAEGSRGMTLRDWFAGQALASGYCSSTSVQVTVESAYRVADWMLAERAK